MAEPAPPLRALLVGIDRYPEPPPGAFTYYSLFGAVRDVARVEHYLRETLEVPGERITRLLAPHRGGDPARLPTHANLTEALTELEAACRPGEQAFVYYSGHGGRAPTLVPEIKGSRGLDEVLVPADIGDPGVPYLRDVEIAAWLARFGARGVFVTLILDCCHSGGASRRNRRVRGNENVDRTPRPADRLLASREEIAAVWRKAPPEWQRDHLELVPVRAQAPTGYALLAACRPQELAVEVEREDGWSGVLTDTLLAALGRADERGVTWRRLHTLLTARLHAAGYLGQTPVVDGEADRLLFGREKLPGRRGVEVVEVESWPGERIRLGTGSVHGTRRGERFALVAVASAAVAERLAEAEVTEVGQTASWATLGARRPGARAPRAGDAAILVDPGPLALRRTVGWCGRGGGLRSGGEEDRSAWLAALLADHGDGFLAAAPNGAGADFEIVETGGLLEIRDAGGAPIPNLGPPLPLVAPGTARELSRRLDHLARYWNVRALENPNGASPLAGALRMRIERLPDPVPAAGPSRAGAGPADEPFMAPLIAGGPSEVAAGARLRLTLENSGERALNVAVLDLQPDWGIQQVHPHRDAAPWATLEPGRPIEIDLAAHLPRGLDEGVDVLKAVAATVPFDLAGLERPALAAPPHALQRGRSARAVASTDPFGRLLAALGAARGPSRAVRSGETAPESWTTAAVEVRVVGEGGAARDSDSDRSTRGARAAIYRPSPLAFERRSGP